MLIFVRECRLVSCVEAWLEAPAPKSAGRMVWSELQKKRRRQSDVYIDVIECLSAEVAI